MTRKNRTPEENARREKIRELLQMANIGSMDDIQNLFKETIAEFMENGLEAELDDELNILVREYRCSGGTDTANPAAGNRCTGTGIPHLIDCYLRVYSLKAGSNPYTSRIDL